MMTAKARGKSQVVFFDDSSTERPETDESREDVRSIAHLKMLQTLAGKLNRSTDVREIGMAIANELRQLIDYHNCRIFVRDGEELQPIAFQGELTSPDRPVADLQHRGRGASQARGQTGESRAPRRPPRMRVRDQDEALRRREAIIACNALRRPRNRVSSSQARPDIRHDDLRLLEGSPATPVPGRERQAHEVRAERPESERRGGVRRDLALPKARASVGESSRARSR